MPKCLDSQKCCESCGIEFDREDLASGKCASCLAEDYAEEVEAFAEKREQSMDGQVGGPGSVIPGVASCGCVILHTGEIVKHCDGTDCTQRKNGGRLMPTGREQRESEVVVSGAVGTMLAIDKIVWHGDKMMLQELDERIAKLKQYVDRARELFAEGK